MEVTTETTASDGSEQEPESGGVTVPTAETLEEAASSEPTPDQTVTTAASPTPLPEAASTLTDVPACQPEAPETGPATRF